MSPNRKRCFSENLKRLCARRRSVSEVCRRIGINRQQFGRYLGGASLPSPHNMLRIAGEFRVPAEDLFLPPGLFAARHDPVEDGGGASGGAIFRREALFSTAFPGDLRGLRRLRGFYHAHFVSPAQPGKVVRSLVSLHERDGYVWTKAIERDEATGGGRSRLLSKYEGMASLLNDRLFVMEFEAKARDALVETILAVPRRREIKDLYGMTFGISSEVSTRPFASPVVWVHLGQSIHPRDALANIAPIPRDSRQLQSSIRSFFDGVGFDPFTIDAP